MRPHKPKQYAFTVQTGYELPAGFVWGASVTLTDGGDASWITRAADDARVLVRVQDLAPEDMIEDFEGWFSDATDRTDWGARAGAP